MGKRKKKKCCHCGSLFVPNPRIKDRQCYCSKVDCQRASKTESHKKWLNKSCNRNYFSGPDHVRRVQEWRTKNPGYWKRPRKAIALQDEISPQPIETTGDNGQIATTALQDLLLSQQPVFIGLIAQLTGSALQDEIASTLLRMQQSGQDILCLQPKTRGGVNDRKASDFNKTGPQCTKEFWMGRPPVGPG